MTTLKRVTLCASLAIVAVMATAVPLKPAAADNDWNNGRWHNGNRQGEQDRDWNGGQRYYGGPTYYYSSPPTYYYRPAPTYYYQPRPYYYQPRPYYSEPGINFNVVIP